MILACWAALRRDGTIWMWGEDRGGVTQIACGDEHRLALRRDGTVWTWGSNKEGQLGMGDTEPRGRPTQVADLSGVTLIRASAAGSMARTSDGTLYYWGPRGGSGSPHRVPVELGKFATGTPTATVR